MQKVLKSEQKPELVLDLARLEKDWPELKLAPEQVNMLGPQLSSTQEHGKRWEPTKEGDQGLEMGTGLVLWPTLVSTLMLMGKPQLMPKGVVQGLLRQQVPGLEPHWSTEMGLMPK